MSISHLPSHICKTRTAKIKSQMDFMNSFLSIVMHIAITVFLLVYLPVSLLVRIAAWLFIRPFSKEGMKGKVVLITGASSGIGEQLAYEYAGRGACMALVARREQALRAVAKRAQELGSPDVLVIPADISSSTESKRVIEETVARFGKLNHLVVNAGLWCSSFFEEIADVNAFNQLMDVNFWGSIYPTYYAIPHLKNSDGRIVVNSSVAGRIPTARSSVYNASKAAVIRFYETLRSELGSAVHITIVTPGYVASELTKGKALQKNGEVGVNTDSRDIQVGPLPVGDTKNCAKVIIDGACRGDRYITWPSWYKPLCMVMSLAPEVVDLFSRSFHVGTLNKTIMEVTGVKRCIYPASIRSSDTETETSGGN